MSHRCPDEQTLAALFDGALDAEARAALHGAMLGCADCVRALAAIGSTLAEEAAAPDLAPPPAHVLARARALVAPPPERPWAIAARFVRDTLESVADAMSPLPAPALAVRGATAHDPGLRYEIDVEGTPVEVHLLPVGPGRASLTARPVRRLPPQTRLVVESGGRVEASLSVDAEPVAVPDLEAGRYRLRFVNPVTEPTVVALRLES